MPKISIIIPVFNAEHYICECLDSIEKQSFVDWECLLVDDGSLDNSGIICDRYALKDSRFRVFHKLNGGVSSARNYGLDKACGEWVTFIDSDDFISPTFIEGLYAPIANGEHLDFVHGGCTNWTNFKPSGINQSYEYFVGDEPGKIFEELRGLAVSKLFRLDFIKQKSKGLFLCFDEKMRIAEDMAFALDYILFVKRYAFVPEVGYYYRLDNMTSATKSKKITPYDVELHSFRHLYNSTIEFVKCHNLSLPFCKNRYSQRGSQLQNVILSLYRNNYPRAQRLKCMKTDFSYPELLMLKYVSCNWIKYLLFIILRLNLHLFDAIVFILYKIKLVK